MIVQHKQQRLVEDVLFEVELPEFPGWSVFARSDGGRDVRLIARSTERHFTLGYSVRDQTMTAHASVGEIPAADVQLFLVLCAEFHAAWLAWQQIAEPQTVTLSLGPDGLRIEER